MTDDRPALPPLPEPVSVYSTAHGDHGWFCMTHNDETIFRAGGDGYATRAAAHVDAYRHTLGTHLPQKGDRR